MPDALKRIEQSEIREIIAAHYGIPADDVCLYHNFEFVRKGDDKQRQDYVYGIADLRNKGRGEIIDT